MAKSHILSPFGQYRYFYHLNMNKQMLSMGKDDLNIARCVGLAKQKFLDPLFFKKVGRRRQKIKLK
jgi:hypothetical protein